MTECMHCFTVMFPDDDTVSELGLKYEDLREGPEIAWSPDRRSSAVESIYNY